MTILLIIAAILVILAMVKIGLLGVLLWIACTVAVIGGYCAIRKKSRREDASESLKNFIRIMQTVLPKLLVILVIIGIIAFFVGLAGGESSTSYTKDYCGICGGDGWFNSKICKNCDGIGYEVKNSTSYAGNPWMSILMATSAALMYFVVLDENSATKDDK